MTSLYEYYIKGLEKFFVIPKSLEERLGNKPI
jgi:hypothetical protein